MTKSWIAAALTITATLAGPLPAASQEDVLSQIARCARFEGALERLDCFDRIARAHQVDGPQPRPGDGLDVGAWKVSEKINPLDDTRTINLLLEASSGQTSMGRTPTLVLRCQSGEVNVYVV